jgi:ATP-dependent helicase/nuclease subunit A
MAFKPTKPQKLAIEENGNILVSAAAGSGKTAVLVERVIKKLCDDENPVRADELLIVTFTNAAAAEMRSRIEKRIDEETQKNPDNIGLLLQKHLLSNAKICTIDSFCIDLVRENFDKLGISPDFKIGEAATLDEINREVIYSIINRYFNEKDRLFFELLDILLIYRFSLLSRFDDDQSSNLRCTFWYTIPNYLPDCSAGFRLYDLSLDSFLDSARMQGQQVYEFA